MTYPPQQPDQPPYRTQPAYPPAQPPYPVQPQMPVPPPITPVKRGLSKGAIIGIVAGAIVALCCVGGVVAAAIDGSSTEKTAQPTVAASATAAPASSAAEAPAATTAAVKPSATGPTVKTVTMPKLVGENAQVAYETLQELGFTKVSFGSADADDTLVLYPPNWTVTKQTTKSGVKVRTDKAVVLTCTKDS
jgi:hypothetical protein